MCSERVLMAALVLMTFFRFVGTATPAVAAPEFTVIPTPVGFNPVDFFASLDAWEASVGGNTTVLELESLPAGADVDSESAGFVSVDFSLENDGGALIADTLQIFNSSFGPLLFDNMLLNRVGGSTVDSTMVFKFDTPIRAFGLNIGDDFGTDASYVLIVTESGGAEFTSPSLPENGITLAHTAGFLGARSDVGIVEVRLRSIDAKHLRFYEADFLRVVPFEAVPVPALTVYGQLGLVVSLMLVSVFGFAFRRLVHHRAGSVRF